MRHPKSSQYNGKALFVVMPTEQQTLITCCGWFTGTHSSRVPARTNTYTITDRAIPRPYVASLTLVSYFEATIQPHPPEDLTTGQPTIPRSSSSKAKTLLVCNDTRTLKIAGVYFFLTCDKTPNLAHVGQHEYMCAGCNQANYSTCAANLFNKQSI